MEAIKPQELSELKTHEFIVFGPDHYNTLGIVRSLGEAGIACVAIVIVRGIRQRLVNSSKYPKAIYRVANMEEGFERLLKFRNSEKKPFVYTSSDDVCELLDSKYDTLKEHFFFFHGKEQGIVSKYLNKDKINEIAVLNGCQVLKNKIVNKGELSHGLRYRYGV